MKHEFFKFGMTLVSFAVCYFMSGILCKTKFFAFLDERKNRHGTLDGLRGFMAISVLFHHYIITWYWKAHGSWHSPPEDYFQNYGKVAIAVFFMITGFLFVSKILKSHGDIKWLKLLESRIFRIFPVYLFAVAVVSIIVFSNLNNGILVNYAQLAKQYFRWAIFHGVDINNFENTRVIVAKADWTLKYEWLFYGALPLLSIIITKTGWKGVTLLSILVIFLYIKPITLFSFNSIFLTLFLIGGAAAHICNKANIPSRVIRHPSVSAAALLVMLFAIFYPNTFDPIHVLAISAFFLIVVLGNDIFGLFSLRSSKLVGEVSYSIYLLHGIVLYLSFTFFNVIDIKKISVESYLLYLPIIAVFVIILSSITYICIEKPSVQIGRKYILDHYFGILYGYARRSLRPTF